MIRVHSVRHESGAKGQGIHPNHDHPETARAEGQNRRRWRFFEIWCPETFLKYPPKGATGVFL